MKVVSVSHLNKTFKVRKKQPGFFPALKSFFSPLTTEVKALEDISFDINEGEFVGFIGPNGAGKTTTLKCLSGLLYPSHGICRVLGFTPQERRYEFLREISLIMGQKNQLWWDLPAMDTFKLNKEIYEISDGDYRKNLGELVGVLNVHKYLETPVRKLSLGTRMKMELIAVLLHHPKVLFLDEPTIGLDVVMQKNMRDFIAEYNKKYNATVLLTSHYMTDVKMLCKRVIIIDRGRIIYDGALEKLVDRYSGYKLITLTLRKRIPVKEFIMFGEIKYSEFPKMVLKVKKVNSAEAVGTILKKFPVDDLNIEDPEIEDIIRMVFTKV